MDYSKHISLINEFSTTVQELFSAKNKETLFKLVSKSARKLTGADGSIFVKRENETCFYVEEDSVSPLWKGSQLPMETCISGWVMRHKDLVVIPDIYSDSRIPHDNFRHTFIRSMVMVPVNNNDPIGALGLFWSNNYVPSETDLNYISSLAEITAVVIKNIDKQQELEQNCIEQKQALETARKDLESYHFAITHNLQVPLKTINGYISILAEDHYKKLDKETKLISEKLKSSAFKLTLLYNDLITLIKTASKELVKTLVSMDIVVKTVCESLIKEDNGKKIMFNIAPLPEALADGGLIKLVWMHLISNAIKFSGVSAAAQFEIGSYTGQYNEIVYYVKDYGIGIHAKKTEKIFGIFQKFHKNPSSEGTGIGLAIVQKIVTRHGGKVWAESIEGESTTFYFTLEKTPDHILINNNQNLVNFI
jgi:K+-sensing histidine kinase KdpD